MPPSLARAFVFVLTCVSALFIAEWSIRLALPSYDPIGNTVFQKDPSTGLVLGQRNSVSRQVKNSGDYDVGIRINRHGFRDRNDVATGRPDDLYVVGDSFTFGWGVEEGERFSSRLSALTGKRTLNLASPVNIDSYEKMLSYATSLGAEIRNVVIAINMIDDFVTTEPAPAPAPVTSPADTVRNVQDGMTVAVVIYRVKNFLVQNSAFYFALTSSLNSIDWLRAALVRVGLIATLDNVWGAPGPGAVEQSMAVLSRIAQRYSVTILLIPSRGLWIGDKQKELAGYHQRIYDELARRCFRIVDMRPVMVATSAPIDFHFRNDGHWNPKGHALAAEALAKAIR